MHKRVSVLVESDLADPQESQNNQKMRLVME